VRVARWYNNRDVRLEEMPTPRIGPGELLVRVEASGICGSDVMEWYRLDRAPLVLGHEIGGQIVAVGEGVERYKEGERVSAPILTPAVLLNIYGCQSLTSSVGYFCCLTKYPLKRRPLLNLWLVFCAGRGWRECNQVKACWLLAVAFPDCSMCS